MSPTIVLSLLAFFTTLNADVSEFFDNLTIDVPLGTLFPGENAEFSCHAKNFDGNGKLIWHWHFQNRSTHSVIDPEDDEVTKSENGVIRKSIIQIPASNSQLIAYIGCELLIADHSNKKLVPIDIFKTLPRLSKHNRKDATYPQIALEIYGSFVRRSSKIPSSSETEGSDQPQSYRHPPNLVTNQTNIQLSLDAKSIRLTCIFPKEDVGLYEWAISGELENGGDILPDKKHGKDDPNKVSLILNKMGLIYREAVTSGRLPPPSEENDCGNQTNFSRISSHFQNVPTSTPTGSEILEVIVPPIVDQSQTLTYTCRPRIRKDGKPKTTKSSLAYVEITLIGTRANQVVEQRDQDFLELINILAQILQNSSGESGESGGGGSGPIYGVGFGSSTIMILMALTIYYLKRQLTQIQEQVKEHDERKKLNKKRPKQDDEESEL